MNIKLINKFLYFSKYRLRCAIGKRGITYNKKEGDQKTPRGTYKLETVFYRKDRVKSLKTLLKKIIIKRNMGWCDSSKSKFYNKLIKFPFSDSAEKMWLKEKTRSNETTPHKNQSVLDFVSMLFEKFSLLDNTRKFFIHSFNAYDEKCFISNNPESTTPRLPKQTTDYMAVVEARSAKSA